MERIQSNTKETTCPNIPTQGKTNKSNRTKLDITHGKWGTEEEKRKFEYDNKKERCTTQGNND